MFSPIFFRRFLFSFVSVIFLGLLFSAFYPQAALAQNKLDSNMKRYTGAFAGEKGAGFSSSPEDPRIIAGRVITAFLSIFGIMFLAYAVYAGYLIMFSGGEEDKIRKGKSTLKTSIIGVFVVFSAYSILYFIVGSVWFATQSKPDSYFETGSGTQPYDYCQGGVVNEFGDCIRR